MSESRIKNTKRNMFFSYLEMFVSLIFAFVSRTIIIKTFGDEYLGLSSLFSSILQVLNMAELGFSGAIVFNMYKPLADGDTEKVCALLAYYKRIYRIVGCVIVIAGLALIPFLPKLITGTLPEGINLYALYLLYLANTGISYFVFAYKAALLNAVQRMDLTKIAYAVVSILQHLVQIIILMVFKNYYLFIFINILGTVFKNLLTAWIANKKYPDYQCRGEISGETKKDIISRVKGLLVCNISGITYTTFDSIILSSFIGLAAVAIYNNYLVIFNNIANLIVMIRQAMQASVGNSVAKETKEKNYQDMLLWQFLFAVIATWCVACLLSLYQPFMTIWMGAERLLPMVDVVLLCLWFFYTVLSHSFFLYLSGNGLWWEMRWPYILSTVCNLVLNMVLGKFFGTTGIIFSTWIAGFIFGFVWQGKIIIKQYFQRSMMQFMKRFCGYFFVCSVSAGIAFGINHMLPDMGIPGLLIKLLICTLSSVATMWLIYRKSEIYQRAIEFARKVVSRNT